MSIHNKKTARLLQGVVLGLIIISATLFLGCETPVGGAEQNPIEELVGKKYKGDSEYDTFSISQDDTGNIILTIGSGTDDTIGQVVESKSASQGFVYLLKCSQHKNWGAYQYPNYPTNEEPHENCYHLVHVRSSSTQSVEWATFYTSVDTKPTACFDSNSLFKAKEYLDFSKWDEPYSYSTGIAQN